MEYPLNPIFSQNLRTSSQENKSTEILNDGRELSFSDLSQFTASSIEKNKKISFSYSKNNSTPKKNFYKYRKKHPSF